MKKLYNKSFFKKNDPRSTGAATKMRHTYLYTLQKQLQKEKNKYKYTNLWKVNSPNKTDCVS